MDFGFRKEFGDHPYFDGWERLGVGIRPVADQVEALKERGLEKLQFDFSGDYGNAPSDMSLLDGFPEAQAVQCSAHFQDSSPLNNLTKLKSFRDEVYNRRGLDWDRLSSLEDLSLVDCRARYQPNLDMYKALKHLEIAHLPKRYATLGDFQQSALRTMHISASRLESFEGLERHQNLSSLSVISCNKLCVTEVGADARSLRTLVLAFCSKVTNFDFVRDMPGLETLEIERLGEIESWEGLRDHKSLRRIQGPPLKGALIPPDILASLKCLEFISSSFTAK